MHHDAPAPDLMARRIDFDRADTVSPAGLEGRYRPAPQHRAQSSEQLADSEGLVEIVVRAEIERCEANADASLKLVEVDFPDASAFANINTLAELNALPAAS